MTFEPPPSVKAQLAELPADRRETILAGIPWCEEHDCPNDEDEQGFYCPECRVIAEPRDETLFNISEDPQSGTQHIRYVPTGGLPDFDGRTYDRLRDHARLGKQAFAVWEILQDSAWHTLAEIAQRTGYPEASISARIRDLRKPKFGGYDVRRDNAGGGLWRYRLVP